MKYRGFTIVELLIVIVVIGILAGITIVAYNGAQNSARKASLSADLSKTSKQIELFKTEKMMYPTSITDCPNPSAQNICAKNSPGNTLSYFVDNTTSPQFSCMTAVTSSNLSMSTISGGNPKDGDCSSLFPSCWALKNSNFTSSSGLYSITLRQTNETIPVYCDMVTSGGGWTLLISNPGPPSIWDTSNVLSLNSNAPSISAPYSILNQADKIKSNLGGSLNYRIDASALGQWGGVWSAPYSNTFTGVTQVANVTNIEKYSDYAIGNNTIKNVMPWLSAAPQILSTWQGSTGDWWGTLVSNSGSYAPAPWITPQQPGPQRIWYWVK